MDKSDSKIFLGIIFATLIIIFGGIFIFSKDNNSSSINSTTDIGGQPKYILGNKKAEVTIVEFSDYQCPACGIAHPVVKQVLEKYQNKVRFIYRHFPLPQHEFARLAAQSAEAAGIQGKYWQMHDLLFTNQNNLTKEDLIKYAKQLKLDMTKFQKDLDSEEVKTRVQNDLLAGNKIGINQTPTFFINGEKYDQSITAKNLEEQINKFL